MASETSTTPTGPVPAAEEPAAAGTSGVWDVYFGRPAPPEGGVNWAAYSHEELYQMLWQDADVADVSTVAAEWSEHRAALVNHAEVLREQRAALLESWQGTGAEQAARRLGVLAERVEKIAELAGAGERAAEQAADALARARAMMPPLPGGPSAPMTDAATNWANVTAPPAPATAGTFGAPGPSPSWTEFLPPQIGQFQQSTATDTTKASTYGPDPGGTFGAVGGAGFSFYVGANATDLQKQQAIRAMQAYESSLTSSSELIGQARSTIPSATALPSSAAASIPRAVEGRPSWQNLVTPSSAGGPVRELAAGATVGTLAGGAGVATGAPISGSGVAAGMNYAANPLAPGKGVGAGAMPGGPGAAAAARMATEAGPIRAGGAGGMVPPGAGARGGSAEQEHKSQLPTIDHQLFPVAQPGSEAVIGLSPEEHR